MDEHFEWDEDDIAVGRSLIIGVSILMLCLCGFMAYAGFSNWDFLGWPLLAGFVFVGLRVFKTMTRNTLESVRAIVLSDQRETSESADWNPAPQRSPLLDALMERRRNRSRLASEDTQMSAEASDARAAKSFHPMIITLGLAAYGLCLAAFWYGLGIFLSFVGRVVF